MLYPRTILEAASKNVTRSVFLKDAWRRMREADFVKVGKALQRIDMEFAKWAPKYPLAQETEVIHYLHSLLDARKSKRVTTRDFREGFKNSHYSFRRLLVNHWTTKGGTVAKKKVKKAKKAKKGKK